MSVVWSTFALMLMLQMKNLAFAQFANCSTSCLSPLTSNFSDDCINGRLSNYAQCLSGEDCLNAATANGQLNLNYCGEGGCVISCRGTYVYTQHIAL